MVAGGCNQANGINLMDKFHSLHTMQRLASMQRAYKSIAIFTTTYCKEEEKSLSKNSESSD